MLPRDHVLGMKRHRRARSHGSIRGENQHARGLPQPRPSVHESTAIATAASALSVLTNSCRSRNRSNSARCLRRKPPFRIFAGQFVIEDCASAPMREISQRPCRRLCACASSPEGPVGRSGMKASRQWIVIGEPRALHSRIRRPPITRCASPSLALADTAPPRGTHAPGSSRFRCDSGSRG